jgi:hypothetical protein
MFLVPDGLKDFIELCDSVGVMLGLVGSAAAALRWYITREQRQAAGRKAIQQIDVLATNHFPHMEKELQDQSEKMDQHAAILNEQTKILASVDRNIGLLVDRGNRGSRQSDNR